MQFQTVFITFILFLFIFSLFARQEILLEKGFNHTLANAQGEEI